MPVSRVLICFLFVFFGSACFNQPDCLITTTAAIKIDFKHNRIDVKTRLRTVVDTLVSFKSIQVSGIKGNLLKRDTAAVSFVLPIDPNITSVKYTFERKGKTGDPTVMDSISFSYTAETKIIAANCGAFPYFLNLYVTQTNYETKNYKTINTQLLKGATNVQIFF